tara:strand:- start:1927 stop:2697 length:771 start_codon:yes stop_codon:yes gene_type:complete
LSTLKKIREKSTKIKKIFLDLIVNGGRYHLGGSLSCLDILVTLIYGNFIKMNNYKLKNFILSKGHALGILHSIMIEKKIINKKILFNLKKKGSIGGQLDIFNFKKNYFEWNSGSLGHSVGVAIGMSIAEKKSKIVTLIGDAEIDEGSIWEGLFFISDKKIDNVIIIIDRNNVSASSIIEKKKNLEKNFLKKLDLNILELNGHNIKEIYNTFKKIYNSKKSSIIIANTIKGKGVKEIENNLKYSHHLPKIEILKKYL